MEDVLRVIPLGGLGEVGKNMTVYGLEVADRDVGLAEPRADERPGIRAAVVGHRGPDLLAERDVADRVERERADDERARGTEDAG